MLTYGQLAAACWGVWTVPATVAMAGAACVVAVPVMMTAFPIMLVASAIAPQGR